MTCCIVSKMPICVQRLCQIEIIPVYTDYAGSSVLSHGCERMLQSLNMRKLNLTKVPSNFIYLYYLINSISKSIYCGFSPIIIQYISHCIRSNALSKGDFSRILTSKLSFCDCIFLLIIRIPFLIFPYLLIRCFTAETNQSLLIILITQWELYHSTFRCICICVFPHFYF